MTIYEFTAIQEDLHEAFQRKQSPFYEDGDPCIDYGDILFVQVEVDDMQPMFGIWGTQNKCVIVCSCADDEFKVVKSAVRTWNENSKTGFKVKVGWASCDDMYQSARDPSPPSGSCSLADSECGVISASAMANLSGSGQIPPSSLHEGLAAPSTARQPLSPPSAKTRQPSKIRPPSKAPRCSNRSATCAPVYNTALPADPTRAVPPPRLLACRKDGGASSRSGASPVPEKQGRRRRSSVSMKPFRIRPTSPRMLTDPAEALKPQSFHPNPWCP